MAVVRMAASPRPLLVRANTYKKGAVQKMLIKCLKWMAKNDTLSIYAIIGGFNLSFVFFCLFMESLSWCCYYDRHHCKTKSLLRF